MPKKPDFIKDATVKSYVRKIQKFRSSKEAISKIDLKFNALIKSVLALAQKLAKKDRRKTILDEDVAWAFENKVGKRQLTWEETAAEVIRQNPTDLGKISKAVNDYIKQHRK